MDGQQVTAAAQVVMDARFWTATAIFAVSYGLIMSEKLHKTAVAVLGAALMLILTGTSDPRHALAKVEWPTIAFFVGLFIIVGGVVKVGFIRHLSYELLSLTRGDMFATSMSVRSARAAG